MGFFYSLNNHFCGRRMHTFGHTASSVVICALCAMAGSCQVIAHHHRDFEMRIYQRALLAPAVASFDQTALQQAKSPAQRLGF
jgi:hypothetical protein